MSNDTTEPTGSEGSGTTRAVAPEVLVRALDEHAIVAVTDRRGRILEVNERFCAISGYSREQLLGQDHRILNSGRHPRRYMSDMWRTILRGKVWHGEFCNRARDGRLYWVQTSIVPMMDDQGRPERFVSIRTEITAQKLAEASLAESESRFRRLFEQSGDALLLLDADSHHFIEANFAAARMLGFADATALRQISPAKLSPPTQEDGEPSADKAGRMIRLALERGTHRFEWLHCSEHRSTFPVEVLLTAIAVGKRQLLFVTWRDITAKRDEQQFVEASTRSLDLLARGEPLPDCVAPLFDFAAGQSHGLGLALLQRSRWSAGLRLVSAQGLCESTARHLQALLSQPAVGCSMIEFGECAPDCPQRRCRQYFESARTNGHLRIERIEVGSAQTPGLLLSELEGGGIDPSLEGCGFRSRWMDLLRLLLEQSALREEQALSRAVFRHGAEGVLVCDAEGRILLANPALARLVGTSAQALTRMQLADILETAGTASRDGGAVDYRGRRVDGRDAIWRALRTPLPKTADGVDLQLWMLADVTAERQQRSRIEHLAYYDPLTGLPNRSLMQERLHEAVRQADLGAGTLALLYLDLDRFKEINDGCGHGIGDQVLQALGARLGRTLQPGELLARMGGDEFMLLLPQAEPDAAVARGKALVETVSQPLRVSGRSFSLGASCGISLYPGDALDGAELMKHADIAMYEAKGVRGAVRIYSQEVGTSLNRRLLLAERLKLALAEGRLRLHYQPQIRLADGTLLGAEALLRWQEPDLGWVSPTEFVDVAERSGLMSELGAWVLNAAFSQWSQWQGHGLHPPERLSLNISALQLVDPDFEGRLETLRRRHAVDARHIELELTESSLIADPEAAIALFGRLVRAGYSLAIDDFGTGYSSLSYLKRLPVSRLKIDRSFVRDMLDNPNDQAIVETVLAMARALGLGTVAEGTESEATSHALAALGCDAAQGYYYSAALSADAFADAWLKQVDPARMR